MWGVAETPRSKLVAAWSLPESSAKETAVAAVMDVERVHPNLAFSENCPVAELADDVLAIVHLIVAA